MSINIVRKGESSSSALVDMVGGKGHNLLRLSEFEKGRDYLVPEFYILPVGSRYSKNQLMQLFGLLKKPLAIRSSSPYEDLEGYSFAGRFKSVLGIDNFSAFEGAITEVLDSARDSAVGDYAKQHRLQIDYRMAVIVQELIEPSYSGVCYSTSNPSNLKTRVEFVLGLSDELMSGDKQGSIASFDRDFKLVMEHGEALADLERVAKAARTLEDIFSERLDVEFAVSKERNIYVVQARPVTDPAWPQIQLPELENSRIFLEADIVRGSGNYTGQVFVFRSPTELHKYCIEHNRQPMTETYEQWHRLREFNSNHPEGYCLLIDNLEAHEIMMKEGGLTNLKALITVDYASRFSHPIKVVLETGAFYLGVIGRKDLLDSVATGDTITIASDQSRGIAYDLSKKPVCVERRKATNLQDITVVQYDSAMLMEHPDYEEVDSHLFMDRAGRLGVFFSDYNETLGVPDDVFYILIDEGFILAEGRYQASKVIIRSPDFPGLLNLLFTEARNLLGK